ncbi:MAG: S41 family peptidase [Lachnospiraceae bacterium]|nr:S41 family peptidase [Lachnospiraceae bacterium]
MREGNSERRSYVLGLLTGLIIVAFLFCIVFIVKTIIGPGESTEGRGRVASASHERPSSDDPEDEGVTPTEGADPVPTAGLSADDGYVLDDPQVMKKIDALEDIIDREYIDSVSNDALSDGIYSGMMKALNDPYAEYYTPEEWIEMQQSTAGIYYGIGAYLTKDTETLYPRITQVIKDTPAEESGLMDNDYIIEVNGEDVYDQDLSDVVSKIKGEEGTTVNLKIVRGKDDDREELDFVVERRRVETPTVEYKKMDDGIAYIAISEFDIVTTSQFEEAMKQARADNMTSLIIDLRGNPGGSLRAVVDIGSMILPKGRIVYTEDKYGNQDTYESDGKHELDVPLVVLVDGNSASASEILAGAIKDYKLGTLIGTKTFGKGIVQQLFNLKDGSAVKLTVSHYYTPNGNDIHKKGIDPDIVVEFDGEAYKEDKTDNQLNAAIDYLTK